MNYIQQLDLHLRTVSLETKLFLRQNQIPEELVLPTNTTWTLANLCWKSVIIYPLRRYSFPFLVSLFAPDRTYAAVAAKISTLFASVTKLKAIAKIAVKAHTTASLVFISESKYRMTMAAIGIRDDIKVPSILAMWWK